MVDMRMPRRRWTDFPAGLRQVRVSSGLTQSDLAEMLNVDQATVSRWERGAQMPDAEMQARLRDILFRGRAISDSRLTHFVRSAHSLMALISPDSKFVALSESARALVPENGTSLNDIMTPSSQEVWNAGVMMSFNEVPFSGTKARADSESATNLLSGLIKAIRLCAERTKWVRRESLIARPRNKMSRSLACISASGICAPRSQRETVAWSTFNISARSLWVNPLETRT